MHITLETDALRRMVDITAKVSTKHVTLPVLQCLLLEARDGTLCVRSTNLEIGIEGRLTAEVKEEGRIAVPANLLLQTISLMQHSSVTLFTEGDVLIAESNASKTEIKSINAEEFPTIPHLQTNPIRIESGQFAYGIKTVALMASPSSIKPELGSVYIFQKKEHTLTFVATDSFRLMEKTISQKNIILSESILVPYKNALELARVAELVTGDIDLFLGENQCALQAGDIYITSRLISGSFPDYEPIIPKEYAATALTLTKDLMLALKKTNIFLNKFLQLTLTLSPKSITLSSQSGEFGSTTESINASVEGDELSINFNQRYIADVLPHITDESVRLKFAGIGRAMVIENVHDTTLRYLVMPMNK